jgi:hypothetical protein
MPTIRATEDTATTIGAVTGVVATIAIETGETAIVECRFTARTAAGDSWSGAFARGFKEIAGLTALGVVIPYALATPDAVLVGVLITLSGNVAGTGVECVATGVANQTIVWWAVLTMHANA